MAKKNVRDDPQKTQVTENPQMSDIVLVLDKMELLIQAVSEINKNGKQGVVRRLKVILGIELLKVACIPMFHVSILQ